MRRRRYGKATTAMFNAMFNIRGKTAANKSEQVFAVLLMFVE
jgi:hypothetical protein